MADLDYEDATGGYAVAHEPAAPGGMQRMVHLAGALTTVAMIAGVGVWGYQIAVRDVTGIPVVRAMEGPMRVAPVNPGGEVVDHQGLAVNDIPAEGIATPVPEQIELAPRPVALALEDAPGLAAAAPAGATETPVDAVLAAPEAVVPDGIAELPAADSDPLNDALVEAMATPSVIEPAPDAARSDNNVLALADMLAAGATPFAETPQPAADGAGVARSLRPQPRPAAASAAAASAAAGEVSAITTVSADAAAVPVTEVDPDSLPKGTRLVQLGAFDDTETARREWDKLSGRFGELMSGKGRVVQAAQSGGRTFYRLRAHGFEDEADARRFCSALLAENAACIPVAIR
jgi:hypothetical protein